MEEEIVVFSLVREEQRFTRVVAELSEIFKALNLPQSILDQFGALKADQDCDARSLLQASVMSYCTSNWNSVDSQYCMLEQDKFSAHLAGPGITLSWYYIHNREKWVVSIDIDVPSSLSLHFHNTMTVRHWKIETDEYPE